MSYGISISINSGETIDIGKCKSTIRDKGESIIGLPSSYTVIDIETTGLNPKCDKIIEIGAIKIIEGDIVSRFESLIKPEGYINYDDQDNESINYVDKFITKLTGITNEILESAPVIEDVLPRFIEFVQDDILLGHNVNFDINFLYDVLLHKFNYKLSNDFVDLMRLARMVYPNFDNHKLITVAKALEVDTTISHRALGDCITTYHCFVKLSDNVNKNNINLNNLTTRKNKSKSRNDSKYETLKIKDIEANTNYFNEEHPLYNKYCTFTGALETLSRNEAAQLVVNLGGKCLNSITRRTNLLILGNFDYNASVIDGKSSKVKKAEELILKGQDLQIISEDMFYDLVNNE